MLHDDRFILLLALFWGLLIGLFYFGGLWLTVCRLPSSTAPRRLWMTSFVLRLFPALLGLWLALKQNIAAFFVTLSAFFMVRMVMSRRIQLKTFERK